LRLCCTKLNTLVSLMAFLMLHAETNGCKCKQCRAIVQGKSDMRDFTNKQLRREGMDLGRSQQVMAKERERFHLSSVLAAPMSRNERRQLGDQGLEVEKAVA
jgi:hypothetical protein